MNRYFVAGVIIGVIVWQIWQALKRQPPTPPERNDKILGIPDTKDIEAIKEKLRRAG